MSLVNSSARNLGELGEIGPIAFGMWRFTSTDVDASVALVEAALDNGMNLIDTADVYEKGLAEEALGRALRGLPRKDYVLASKVYFPTGPGPNDRGLSRKHIDDLRAAEPATRSATDWARDVRALLGDLASHEARENEILNRVLDGGDQAQD